MTTPNPLSLSKIFTDDNDGADALLRYLLVDYEKKNDATADILRYTPEGELRSITSLIKESILQEECKFAEEICKDIFDSYVFSEKYSKKMDKCKNLDVLHEKAKNIYKAIKEKKAEELQKHFSSSEALLQKLSFPREIKYIASKEHYELLSYYLLAIKCSKEADIRGLLKAFLKISEKEVTNSNISIKITDSVTSIYNNNVRLWLEHFACTFYILDKRNLSNKELIKYIIRVIDGEDLKKTSNTKKSLFLNNASLYGSIRIIANTFSFLRQWSEAYLKHTFNNKRISKEDKNNAQIRFDKFQETLDKIQEKAEFISDKLPTIIKNSDNEQLKTYAKNYASFVLYKITIFLFEINKVIEKFVVAKDVDLMPEGYEDTLRQQVRAFRIFLCHYSFVLGLDNVNYQYNHQKPWNDELFNKFKKHFTVGNIDIQQFFTDNDMMNCEVKKASRFLGDVIRSIKKQNYFSLHKTNYWKDSEEGYKKKIESFEECNPKSFDKDKKNVNIESETTSLTPHKMDKFYILLDRMDKQNENFNRKFEEQNIEFNERFKEQSNEIKNLITQNNDKFSNFENLLSDTNRKIDKISNYSATEYLKYYQDYDLTNTTITVQEKKKFSDFLGIEYIESSDFFNPKTKNNIDRVTELLKDLSINLRDKYYFLIQNFGTIEKGLLFLEYLERDFKKFTNLEQ